MTKILSLLIGASLGLAACSPAPQSSPQPTSSPGAVEENEGPDHVDASPDNPLPLGMAEALPDRTITILGSR